MNVPKPIAHFYLVVYWFDAQPLSIRIAAVEGLTHAGKSSSDFITRVRLSLHFTFLGNIPDMNCFRGSSIDVPLMLLAFDCNTRIGFVVKGHIVKE